MSRRLFQTAVTFFASVGTAFASQPMPWQWHTQEPVTPVMEAVHHMHNILVWLIAAIALLVTAVMIYVAWRFRSSKNPTPSTTTHHTWLEVLWTGIPTIIILALIVPTIKLVFFMDKVPEPEMTIKVTGKQWYWTYDYPEEKISFDSIMIEDKDLKPGQLRLLEVDNRVVVPVDTTVRVLVTAADVLHSWAVPSFGIKKDAIPGRLNETWFRVHKEGVYYGQCSELCGMKHGFMPITVDVRSKENYRAWLQNAQKKFASLDQVPQAMQSLRY